MQDQKKVHLHKLTYYAFSKNYVGHGTLHLTQRMAPFVAMIFTSRTTHVTFPISLAHARCWMLC